MVLDYLTVSLCSTGLVKILKTRCVQLTGLIIITTARGISGVVMKMIRIIHKQTTPILRSASVRWLCD